MILNIQFNIILKANSTASAINGFINIYMHIGRNCLKQFGEGHVKSFVK